MLAGMNDEKRFVCIFHVSCFLFSLLLPFFAVWDGTRNGRAHSNGHSQQQRQTNEEFCT